MDVKKTVEILLFEYFTKKAKEYSCSFSSLSILASISVKEKTALFALYKDSGFAEWVNLKQLVDSDALGFVEKLAAPSLIKGAFFKSLMKYEAEFKTTARIAIYSNLDCFALENYTKRKQITINDII
jgi:hypothetical protein